MLNVPEIIQQLYKESSIRKNFRVHFPNGELPDITNANLVTESVQFTESLCSQEYLKFGLTEASEIQFETIGIGNMMGMEIECSSEIDTSSLTAAQIAEIQEMSDLDGELVLAADSDLTNPDGTTWGFYRVPYGVFTVDSCPRNHGALTHRKVVAYGFKFDDKNTTSKFYKDVFTKYYAGGAFSITSNFIIENMLSSLNSAGLKKYLSYVKTSSEIDERTADFSGRIEIYKGEGLDREFSITVTSGGGQLQQTFSDSSPQLRWLYLYGRKSREPVLKEATLTYMAQMLGDIEFTGAHYNCDYGAQTGIFSSEEEAYELIYQRMMLPLPYIIYNCSNTSSGGSTTSVYYVPVNTDETNVLFDSNDFRRLMNNSTAQIVIRVPYWAEATIDILWDQLATFETRSVDPYDYMGDNWKLYDEYETRSATQLSTFIPPFQYSVKGSAVKFNNTTFYSYDGQIDMLSIIQSGLELAGKLQRNGRDGGLSLVTLDDTDAIQISRSQYFDLWWDEYDVDPIGTIIYDYKNAQAGEVQTATYNFREGGSVYEMKDNFILQNMDNGSQSTINTLLDTYFIPNILNINFTPIDLEMVGLPYLEDGDYITVTAEDGVSVSSFILRHTIKGIQSLQDTIESTNGELMDSEEVED